MAERNRPTDIPNAESDWPPSASLAILRRRASILAVVRKFFDVRDVLEVETPVLSRAAVTDPNIESLVTRYTGPTAPEGATLFLHTSPEFAMKRLLAAGSGSIYQICHVFRDNECGRLHNPEFTMLEYYRVGFDHDALMRETLELLTDVFRPYRHLAEPELLSYQEAFAHHAGIADVHGADLVELRAAAGKLGIDTGMVSRADTLDVLRDLILTHVIEGRLGQNRLTALFDYPASQAALARVRPGSPALAERFEIYLDGIELANGFHELNNAIEQRHRFVKDQTTRRERNQPTPVVDERLLAALAAGLPDCAGVAIGLDRVVMLAAGEIELARVLAFPFIRA